MDKKTVVIPAKGILSNNTDDSNKSSQDKINSTTSTTPQKKSDSITKESTSNTGDTTNVVLWGILFLVSMLGIGGCLFVYRKKKK